MLILAGIGLGIASLTRSKLAPVVVLRQPVQMPVLFRDRFGPATRRWWWAWWMEQVVFGKRKPVNLRADVVSLSDSTNVTHASLALGPPSYADTNGLQVWLLNQDRIKSLRGDLKRDYGDDIILHSFRVSTADGIGASLFQGTSFSGGGATNQVGLAFNCFAQVHSDATDLITCITLSELATNEAIASTGPWPRPFTPIQTNLEAALRVRLPKGKGFFLLDRTPRDPNRRRFGMIVDRP